MFIVDPNNNYLALTLDGNTYYLHHSCTGILQEDIASRSKYCTFILLSFF